MSRQIHFAFLLGLATLAARSEAVAADESVTTLANRQIRYTVPESGYHTMQRGGVTATIVDNGAVDDDTLTGHRAGYSGVASLTHTNRAGNLFVPNYAGLNYEHIHDGTSQDRDILFEPRRAPMELRVVNKHTVELYQAPSPTWKLESVLRYEMLKDGTIEMTLECIPRAKTFRNGYIGLFWASYIHQPRDRYIYLQRPDAHAQLDRWIGLTREDHGSPDYDIRHMPGEEISATDHLSRMHTSEPVDDRHREAIENQVRSSLSFYYGLCAEDMVYLMMFAQPDRVRLAYSPNGGGKSPEWSPAWDYVLHLDDAKLDHTYTWDVCLALFPYQSRTAILDEVSRYQSST